MKGAKMSRRLKILGLCLLAISAVSAVLAGGASAQFESESAETTTTRSANSVQSFQYQESGIKAECKFIEATGTIKGKATTEFEMAPQYKECSSILGPVHFELNGCKDLFTASILSLSISEHFVCPAGKKFTITITDGSGSSICTLHVGSQTWGGSLLGSNVGGGTTREIKVTRASTGIVGERTGSALCGPATSTTGTFSGNFTLTGENPATKAHIGIFMD
jgi:hypothetical protein